MAHRPSSTKLFSHPLAYARHLHGLTQQELARLLAEHLRGSGHRQKVARWESGEAEPSMAAQVALAEIFHVPDERLSVLLWPSWLPMGELFHVEGVWSRENCHSLLDASGDLMLDRRGFVTLATGSAAILVQEWRSVGHTVPEFLDGTSEDIALGFEGRLPWLRDLEDIHGGGRVRKFVDLELQALSELLRQTGHGGAGGRRIFRLIADLCRIAGWASADTGYLAAAERYFVLGLRAARAGGDRLSGANLLKCMSLLLAEASRPQDALLLARSAVDATADAPPRVRAMLAVRQARVHAVLGERDACERLLGRAETAMAEAEADGQPCPDWALYFDAAEYAAQVAACHLALGHFTVSDQWLERTTRLQPASRQRDGITYRLWRAENAVRLGEVERACAHLTEAVPAIKNGFSTRNSTRFTQVRRLLHPYRGLPQVRDLDARAVSLLA
ncbi:MULTISPECIES: helix-turn-helix transcriptional regulator [unclassified Streptomyces]|uniref:helix-turn-helix transcriptional regulator n=1 Tax=unclassified Streptomyces TaxID=2593676 RepID=UPI00081F1953|nr:MULTISPECIES: helix-turn-helix transcriptional regulator [unclassified Streptomyces]MYZ37912.1 transcriptional regulator [Streptomyces sp. SID4917]SCF95103.1 DNA-binding transcriptional regulator, XRE-family HTH domain [Streptomyces sp. MnatMP-M17]